MSGDAPPKSGSAELFNELSFRMLSYLEERLGVTQLAFEAREGCDEDEAEAWDRRNAPRALPKDLRAFYAAFDGLRFSWRVDVPNRGTVTVGSIKLHRLRDVVQVDFDDADDDRSGRRAGNRTARRLRGAVSLRGAWGGRVPEHAVRTLAKFGDIPTQRPGTA
mmetsp:Transcript_36021/g.111484  ORF Transcript_36021/g.111484 Transcript_36021/m.111484 type:complete len:163 (+) Transcript_36021:236-724(+)